MKLGQLRSFFIGLCVFFSGVTVNVSVADELIQYSDNGSILSRYNCDKVSIHDSAQQSTLICKKVPKLTLDVQLVKLFSDLDYRSCVRDRRCVVVDNRRDPSWSAIAIYGIPDAIFGPNAQGRSCVRIRETKPRYSSWETDAMKLCTDHPQVELAYTYAYGYKNDGVPNRFKKKNVKRVCFGEVLRDYPYQKFWKDNCLFVRQK